MGGRPGVVDGGGTVDPPPNGAEACASPACNYQTNAGCASGATCHPAVAGADVVPECQPAGPGKPGEPCEWGGCGAGLFCAEGICRQLCCDGDWSVCPEGESCHRRLSVTVAGEPVPTGASVCSPVGDCSPFEKGSCPPGLQCHVVDSRGSLACVVGGSGAAGEACPCAEGFVCVEAGRDGECRRLCDALGGEPKCPLAEGFCVHFHRNDPRIGECTVP